MSGDWRDLAACLGHPPDLFFPERADAATRAAALRICQACPVVEACRAFALGKAIPHGVWGNQTQHTRNTILGIRSWDSPVEDWQLDLDRKPCGTAAAYRRHQRRGETACAACTEANAQYNRQRERVR